MSEQASPLVATGSIAPGRSIPAILSMVPRESQLTVSDGLLEAWGAVNNLYTHVDNRLDLDHPDSKPGGSPDKLEAGAWQPWFDYLADHSAPLPEATDLTPVQRAAFAIMRDNFVRLGTTDEQRADFIASLSQYMVASWQTKMATSLGGTPDGFVQSRMREARAISRLFTSIVPDELKGRDFKKFERTADLGIRAFKLADSAWDFPRDTAMDSSIRSVNLDRRGPAIIPRARLAGRAAMLGVWTLGRIRDPRMLKVGLQKAAIMVKNRSGKLNDQRTNA